MKDLPKSQGWHSRGYLPHLDFRTAIQAVTFRLGDALPKKVVEVWKRECDDDAELRSRISKYEDAGYGSCLLGKPQHAEVVANALRFFHGERYELLEWVVMPNHVHVMLRPHSEVLERIVKSWKSYAARQINKSESRTGALWAREYFDRYIRDETHYVRAVNYLRSNPVKAGLCKEPEEWVFSSAYGGAA